MRHLVYTPSCRGPTGQWKCHEDIEKGRHTLTIWYQWEGRSRSCSQTLSLPVLTPGKGLPKPRQWSPRLCCERANTCPHLPNTTALPKSRQKTMKLRWETARQKMHLGRWDPWDKGRRRTRTTPGEKSSSKCYLFMNNLKEISSEHKRKMPLD